MVNPNDEQLLLLRGDTLKEESDDDADAEHLLENPLLDDILLDNLIEDSPLMPNTERSQLQTVNLLDGAEANPDWMSPIKDESPLLQ